MTYMVLKVFLKFRTIKINHEEKFNGKKKIKNYTITSFVIDTNVALYKIKKKSIVHHIAIKYIFTTYLH